MKKTEKVHRISISLPEQLTLELDQMVVDGGYKNRSQAIARIVRNALLEHYGEKGSQVMAGSITLVYNEAQPNLKTKLVNIQRKHIDSVISSLNMLLEDNYSMEVLQVQGPVDKLNRIVRELRACKGIENCKLILSSAVIPPIHGKQGAGNDE